MKIGIEHRERYGERYVPAQLQPQATPAPAGGGDSGSPR
jgi:hypothetical protein